jgi:type II secretory pathway pseudopilin PulG
MGRPARTDEGTTLVETLVAVSIVGIAFTALVGGMYSTVVASDTNRKQAAATTYLVSYAEAVKGDAYTACAASYPGAGFTVPAGYTKGALSVAYWNATTSNFDPTCGTDSGLQRVTLSIGSNDGLGVVDVQLLKRAP